MLHLEIPRPKSNTKGLIPPIATWVIQVTKDATQAEAAAWMKANGIKLKVTNSNMGWTLDTRDNSGLQGLGNFLAAPEGGGVLVASILTAGIGGAVLGGSAVAATAAKNVLVKNVSDLTIKTAASNPTSSSSVAISTGKNSAVIVPTSTSKSDDFITVILKFLFGWLA